MAAIEISFISFQKGALLTVENSSRKSRLEVFLSRGLIVGSLTDLAVSFGFWTGGVFPGVTSRGRVSTQTKRTNPGSSVVSYRLEICDPVEFRRALTYSLARLQSPPLSLSRDTASGLLEALLDKELPNWEKEGFSTRTTVSRQSQEARDNPDPDHVDFGKFLYLPTEEGAADDS